MDSNVDKPRPSTSILTSKLQNGATGGSAATGEGVDRRIAKRALTPRRLAGAAAVLLFVALVAWGLSTTAGGRRLNVERDKLTTAEVIRGPFQENIVVTGNAMPRTTVYLDLPNGGRVAEVFAVEGQQVEEGDPLLNLENSDLQLRLLSADAQRIEQRNLLEDMRFRMDQNALSLRQQLAQMNYNILRLQQQHDRYEVLARGGGVSPQEYQDVRDELDYWIRNKDLTLEGYKQDSLRQVTQLRQMSTAVDRMQTNYEVLEGILENLTFKAPIGGQLTAFQAELGEIVSSGARIGQVDVLDGFKVRATVDEFYIARVTHGQQATATLAGTAYGLSVTRVYPEVRNGVFEVDLEFVDRLPPEIRRGQTIRSLLALSEPGEALLVPRGGFFQSTGGQWIYVLTPDGSEAVRRSIRIGRQNTEHYEVLEGLEPGERVITSSYDTFGDDTARLILK